MALSATVFLWTGSQFTGRSLSGWWYVASFLGTWAVYLWDAGNGITREDQINQPERAKFYRTYPLFRHTIPIMLTIPTALAIWLAQPSWETDLLLLAMITIGAAYVLRIIPTKYTRKRLKEIGSIKTYLITIAWLLGGVFLPLSAGVRTDAGPAAPLWVILSFLCLLLFFDTLALDYRDRRGDKSSGLVTIAVTIGKETRLFIAGGVFFCGIYWLSGIHKFEDPRWIFGAGAMWFASLTASLAIPFLIGRDATYGFAIMFWRFAGALGIIAALI